jgi:hypothetical protein
MTEMQIRRGRIETGLDSQWTPQSKFLFQLVFEQQFVSAALDLRKLLCHLCLLHFWLRHLIVLNIDSSEKTAITHCITACLTIYPP